jgi:hypothetical protein
LGTFPWHIVVFVYEYADGSKCTIVKDHSSGQATELAHMTLTTHTAYSRHAGVCSQFAAHTDVMGRETDHVHKQTVTQRHARR